MKIFIDAHTFDGEFQGSRTYIKEIYLQLVSLHPNIMFYFGVKNSKNLDYELKTLPNVFCIEYSSRNSFSRIYIEIPKLIRDHRFNFAHFQYVMSYRKEKFCKYIVTMHDVLFNDFNDEFSFLYRLKRNFLFWLSANRCDTLLTVSNYSRERISSRYKIPYDKIIVTPNGVSKDMLEYESSKADSKKRVKNVYDLDKYVLYVSRIEPRKNQDLVLKWFDKSQLSSQGYKLVFVGKETIHTSFRRIVGSSKNVYWFEQVPYKDLLDFYNAASLFIYPAKAEGFGIPPLEAAAMETPVICSNATAMADFDFFEPYMFDPNSGIEKLDSIVISCLSNISQSRVSSIKSKIANRYGWDRSVSILSSILSSN